jgi:nicotine blue oxidoreductase
MLGAVVLAAGAATRFGAPKQRLLLPAVLERVRGVDQIVVVSGAYPLDGAIHCPEWERGPGASLRCGLASLAQDVEAAVVVLADGPSLASAAIDRVVAEWRASGAPIVAASYGGVRGHPLLVAREAWAKIPDGEPGDVDTPADLPERFRSAADEPM